VDINQVGVPVDINQIPTVLLTASAFNHLETATVLLASTAPICDWAWHGRTRWLKVKVLADRAAL
jgi:hypothetical protein